MPTEEQLLEMLRHGYYTGSGYDSAALQQLEAKFMVDDITWRHADVQDLTVTENPSHSRVN